MAGQFGLALLIIQLGGISITREVYCSLIKREHV